MVHCTRTAAETLERVREQQGIPPEFGIRLFAAESPDGGRGLGLEFRSGPAEGDEVANQFGTQIMVAPEVVEQLADVTLDAIPDPSRNGAGPAQLVLRTPGDETSDR